MTSVHDRFPFPDEEFGRVPRSCAYRRENDPLGSVTLPSGDIVRVRHPEQYQTLVASPKLLPAAVEEILRYDFPADVGFLRFALEDVPLPSGTIRAGEGVMPLISSANQDTSKLHNPEIFDIRRPDTGNLRGAFNVLRLAATRVRAGGSIVTLSSSAAALGVPGRRSTTSARSRSSR
jgi:Cytochrome P450